MQKMAKFEHIQKYMFKKSKKYTYQILLEWSYTMAKNTSANLGFEETLWATADKMRNNMDPSEYKHVILGLIFLKYISDSFETQYDKVKNNPD